MSGPLRLQPSAALDSGAARGELPAGGVDVGAAAAPQRHRDARVATTRQEARRRPRARARGTASPACGFIGIRFSFDGMPRSSCDEPARVVLRVVHAGEQRVLEEDRAARREPSRRRAAPPSSTASGNCWFSGTSSSRTRVGRGVQRDREIHRHAASSSVGDPRHDARRRDRHAPRRHREGLRMDQQASPPRARAQVQQRLAHAHEDDVRDAALGPGAALRMRHDLVDDLGRREIAIRSRARRSRRSEHASGQPTCVETHSVVRSSSGISTDSITRRRARRGQP